MLAVLSITCFFRYPMINDISQRAHRIISFVFRDWTSSAKIRVTSILKTGRRLKVPRYLPLSLQEDLGRTWNQVNGAGYMALLD